MARQAQQTNFDDSVRRFDMRALMRLALWGMSAAAALMFAVLAGYPHFSAQHRIALPPWASTLAQREAGAMSALFAQRAVETDGETENLAAAVRALATDRDALLRRVNALEQTLEAITGAINHRLPAASPGASATILPAPPAMAAPMVRETPVARRSCPRQLSRRQAGLRPCRRLRGAPKQRCRQRPKANLRSISAARSISMPCGCCGMPPRPATPRCSMASRRSSGSARMASRGRPSFVWSWVPWRVPR
jgi:hypothetical protein